MNKKRVKIISAVSALIIMLIIIFCLIKQSNEIIELEFGMFTGSNWQVASANSFEIIDRAIEKFEKRYKNVKVTYKSGISKEDYSQWLAARLIDDNLPDVFMIKDSDFNKFSSLNAIKNLDGIIAKDKGFDKNKFFQTSYNVGNYQERQYALPYETVPVLLFVNKTLLEREGIDIPKIDWVWNDIYEICKKVTKDTNDDGIIDQFGTYNYKWMNAVRSNGYDLVNYENDKIDFTQESVLESLFFIKKLYDLNQGQKATQEDFNTGHVAFMPLTFAEYRTYKAYPYKIKKYSEFKWDFITFPAGPEGDNVSEVDSLLIGISSKTKQEELAWEFLKTLTYDEEIQMDIFRHSQGVSVLKNVTQSLEAENIIKENMDEEEQVIHTRMLSQIIENGTIMPKIKQYNQIIDLADTEINKILEQNKDIDSTIKIFQRRLDAEHINNNE